jgi:hypothetical protein
MGPAGMDHIAPALATHPVTQLGHTAITVIVEKRMNTAVTIIVYVNSLQVKNKPHDKVHFVHFFLNPVQT